MRSSKEFEQRCVIISYQKACPGEPHQPAAPFEPNQKFWLRSLGASRPIAPPLQLLLPWVRNHKTGRFRTAMRIMCCLLLHRGFILLRPSHWPDYKRSRPRRKRANPHPPTGLEIKLPWSLSCHALRPGKHCHHRVTSQPSLSTRRVAPVIPTPASRRMEPAIYYRGSASLSSSSATTSHIYPPAQLVQHQQQAPRSRRARALVIMGTSGKAYV